MKFPLDTIRTKIIGVLEFRALSPIHVGIGGEEVVKELIATPGGGLVIPSSTWKGAFRSVSEQIAKQVGFKGIAGLAVELYSEEAGVGYRRDSNRFGEYLKDFVGVLQGGRSDTIPDDAEKIEGLLGELGYTYEEIGEVKRSGMGARRELLEAMAEEYLALHCPIGRLYGNKVIAGKVRFLDSLINANPGVRAGVGIDRKSGKVVERRLYFIKVIPRTDVKLTMIADNLLRGEDDSRLFAYTLKAMKTLGISIGARKSAGLGNLEVKDGKFYILDVEEDGRTASPRIGNMLKRVDPIALDEFLKWLSS